MSNSTKKTHFFLREDIFVSRASGSALMPEWISAIPQTLPPPIKLDPPLFSEIQIFEDLGYDVIRVRRRRENFGKWTPKTQICKGKTVFPVSFLGVRRGALGEVKNT